MTNLSKKNVAREKKSKQTWQAKKNAESPKPGLNEVRVLYKGAVLLLFYRKFRLVDGERGNVHVVGALLPYP